jgi:cellulose biosynthesis protein BcsQ
MFNHKGGVSKTTSVYNIGWMLSKDNNVLIVDADPQCNLSSLMLGENFEKYYYDENTREHNIKDGVKSAFEGKPIPLKPVDCFSHERSKRLFLLAGHANLSEYDASLTFAQTSNNAIQTLQNLPGAFSKLIELTEAKYKIDYTIIDLNPSLSAINQNLFLSSNFFIVPTNPDPFSLMALNTLSEVLPRWMKWKKSAIQIFSESVYPIPDCTPKFIGTLIQRFNIRNKQPAKPYRENIEEIQNYTKSMLYEKIKKEGMTIENYPCAFSNSGYCIAHIPNFQSLLQDAYRSGVPVFCLKDDEIKQTGVISENLIVKRDEFFKLFSTIAETIERMIDNE